MNPGRIRVLAHFTPGDKVMDFLAPHQDWLDVTFCAEDDDATFYRELPSAEVLWQTGATDVSGLGIDAVETLPAADLEQAIADADLVISHSGVGTSLTTLEHGKCPVLLPRRRDHGEHTDDHQRLIAQELGRRGLAVWADPDRLRAEDLVRASRLTARHAAPPPFLLQPD